MVELGAVMNPRLESDADLKPVTQAGVAPDDFFGHHDYPTEVRVVANGCVSKTNGWTA